MTHTISLSGVPGVFVALHGSRVKVGAASDLRKQIRSQAMAGAQEAVAFPLPRLTGRAIGTVHTNVLDVLTVIARRVSTSEYFEDVTFEHALAIVRACAGSADQTPSPAGVEVVMAQIKAGG